MMDVMKQFSESILGTENGRLQSGLSVSVNPGKSFTFGVPL